MVIETWSGSYDGQRATYVNDTGVPNWITNRSYGIRQAGGESTTQIAATDKQSGGIEPKIGFARTDIEDLEPDLAGEVRFRNHRHHPSRRTSGAERSLPGEQVRVY